MTKWSLFQEYILELILKNQCDLLTNEKRKEHDHLKYMQKKACEVTHRPFLMKILSKLEITWSILSLIKGLYKKICTSIILTDERIELFFLKSGTNQEHLLLLLLVWRI